MRLNSCICLLRSCISSSINGLFWFFVHFVAGFFVLFFFIFSEKDFRRQISNFGEDIPELWTTRALAKWNKSAWQAQELWSQSACLECRKSEGWRNGTRKMICWYWAKLQRLTLCMIMGKLFIDAKMRLPVHKQYCGFIFRLWTSVCWLHGEKV